MINFQNYHLHDLTHTYTDGLPGYEWEQARTRVKDGWNARWLRLYSHVGTHMDAQKHFDVGKHIICQKPLAPTLAESREIHRTCVRAQKRFMVHENFRFQPWHRKIKELIQPGVLGDRLHTITQRMRTGDGYGPDADLGRQPYFRTMPRLLMFKTGYDSAANKQIVKL